MIPVDQTIFGGDNPDPFKRGNCMQAAFASLLELPLDVVPHFVAHDDWRRTTDDWLALHGLWYLPVSVEDMRGLCWPRRVDALLLVSGDSPRGPWSHICVGKLALQDGEWQAVVVHDPHPSRAGLLKINYWDFVLPLDPARQVR